MNSASYITVTEFQQMNPEIDFTNYNDTTISGMISRASSQMDNFLQYSLSVEDIAGEKNEAVITTNGNLQIFPRKFPVVDVTAIQLKLGTVHLNLNLFAGDGSPRFDIPYRARSILYPYQEISVTGVLSIRNFYQLRGLEIFTVLDYRAGFDTIPGELKDACNLITKDIFIRQANPMDLAGTTQGAISMTFKNRGGNAGDEDSKWVQDAKQIMESYRKYTG